jgi:hypothetical protein
MKRSTNMAARCAWLRSSAPGNCALFMLVCAVVALPLSAQTRLEQLEATYLANLRTIHAPILQEYVRQLELLKNRYSTRGQTEEAKRADEELVRIKAIANTSGVLPYTTLEAAAASPTGPGAAPAPPPPPPAKPTALPTLLAAEAFKSGDMNGASTSSLRAPMMSW